MNSLNHPILEQSFAIIDQEIGEHKFTPDEYAIVRRVIHSTADFEFTKLIQFSPDVIASGITALPNKTPIITDVCSKRCLRFWQRDAEVSAEVCRGMGVSCE